MQGASYIDTIDRLLLATQSKTESDLAAALGISAQSVFQAKKNNKVPPQWFFKISQDYGFSADWLFWGRGPMRQGELVPPPLPPGACFSADIVYDVVEILEEYLQGQELEMEPSDKAEVVRQLCQMVVEDEGGEVRPGQMLRLVKRALKAG